MNENKMKVFVVIDHFRDEDSNEVKIEVFGTKTNAEAHIKKCFAQAKEDFEVDKYEDEDRFEIEERPNYCEISDNDSDAMVAIYLQEKTLH